MLRLRMWARIGVAALVFATAAAWVSVAVTPAVATVSPGSKTTDPSLGDPGGGGDPTVGDPDGPGGDVAPASGVVNGHVAARSGAYSSTVQSTGVGSAPLTARLSVWVQLKLALHYWLRSALLRI